MEVKVNKNTELKKKNDMDTTKKLETVFTISAEDRSFYDIKEEEFFELIERNKDCKRIRVIGLDFRGFDFSGKILKRIRFEKCIMINTNFEASHLEEVVFSSCALQYSCFSYSTIRKTMFVNCSLREDSFINAHIIESSFEGSNLVGVDFRESEITKITFNADTGFFALQCPEEGSFIGFKKVWGKNKEFYIVKLLIPEDAKRSSSTSRKCRASYVKTLKIEKYIYSNEELQLIEEVDEVKNWYTRYDNSEVVYKVNEFTYPNYFDENRWNECTGGIHFFITKEEAFNY